jgi:hypothetical protein
MRSAEKTASRRPRLLRWGLSLGGLALAALALLPRPAGQAAPAPSTPRPPAVWPKTTPADRKRSANNLKTIAQAFHNYHDTYNAFPAAAIAGKGGKALLSWRVAILPFVEAGALYKQFRLKEPWDSAHNRKLLPRMPGVYGLPKVKYSPAHATYYRVFTGPDAPFNAATPARGGAWPAGPRILQITDGTSNTLLVVEAREAVPWTKPDELTHDARKPLPRLGGLFREGFHAALFDGSVRFIDPKIDATTLRALITPAGGEVIAGDIPEAKPPRK